MFCYVVPNHLCHALQALVEALGLLLSCIVSVVEALASKLTLFKLLTVRRDSPSSQVDGLSSIALP